MPARGEYTVPSDKPYTPFITLRRWTDQSVVHRSMQDTFRQALEEASSKSLDFLDLRAANLFRLQINIKPTSMKEVKFDYSNVGYGSLALIDFNKSVFYKTNLNSTSFYRCEIDWVSFENCHMARTIFVECNFSFCKFIKNTMPRAKFIKCKFKDCEWVENDLYQSKWLETDIQNQPFVRQPVKKKK